MGLAASQARFLTITARKADCEFQSMSLSHQKLALSRNMESVSDEYQRALTATKLVYDYQATGTSDMNLTYDLLMSPSIYNDYYPKLVTDSKNRCILNSAYAAAARAAGIPAEGLLGTPSSDVRNKFIQALANNGVITAYSAASIQAVAYGNTIGLGTTISATQGIDELNYEQFMERLATTQSSADYGFTAGTNYLDAYRLANGTDANANNNIDPTFPTNPAGGERLVVRDNSTGAETQFNGLGGTATFNLVDLLSGKNSYIYGLVSSQGSSVPVQDAAYLQHHLVGEESSFLKWMDDQFYSVLGGTPQSEVALQYAYDVIYDILYPNNSIQDAYNSSFKGQSRKSRDENGQSYKDILAQIGTCVDTNKHHDSRWTNVKNNAYNYLGIVYHAKKNGDDRHDHADIAVDLSALAQVYLTAYVEYMEGVETTNYKYENGLKSESRLYNPDKSDFKFQAVGDSEIDDGGSDLNASFYDALFNMICTQGWTENAQIDDTDYMTEMMKNGMAFISAISDDGYYYQGAYSNDKTIIEVPDNEAIAQAEAKYNAEKAKIENKEDSIDMKMKSLDTEISALDQEYNTVKSLISKSIEKSFKRYEA